MRSHSMLCSMGWEKMVTIAIPLYSTTVKTGENTGKMIRQRKKGSTSVIQDRGER